MSESTYIVDLNPTEFVTLMPGEAIRLFPFGDVVKDGVTRTITPEYARTFKLPHWDPAVKLGSHKDETPAGAFINKLDVRDDGLYGLIDVTDKGAKAIAEGDYRYQSPEVIWEDGFIEDSKGGKIQGPLIVGHALLHNPHLGERAALFQSKVQSEPMEKNMTNQKAVLEVPDSFWDKLGAMVKRDPKPEGDPEPKPDEFAAVTKERDDLKSEVEDMKAKDAKKEQMAAIKAEFDTDKFGFSFIELGKTEEATDMLARMDEDVRDWVLTNFKAMSSQIKESGLFDEKGHDLESDGSPAQAFNAVVKAIEIEKDITYLKALEIAKVQNADLYKAYLKEAK